MKVADVIPPIVLLLVIAEPEFTSPAVVRDAVMSTKSQWEALASCPRVVIGKKDAFGSAVVIGHKDGFAYLLTAAHVLDESQEMQLHFFERSSRTQPARILKNVEVLFRSDKPDFALLRAKTVEGPLPHLKLAGPNQRPRRFPSDAVSVGCAFGGWPQAKAESISAKLLKRVGDTPEAFFWQTATRPEKGRSGGPLLDGRSRVIGVCAAAQDEKGYFTHLDEILAGLKKAGYDWLWAEQ